MKVAIIGAGPSGLVMAKQLKDREIPFAIFERDADLGGVWNINNEHSVMYESAHTISSKFLTQFTEYPMPTDYSDYVSHHKMLSYFKNYAAEYDLKDAIHFNQNIVEVNQTAQGKFALKTEGQQEVQVFDYLVIATGHVSQPRFPDLDLSAFNGDVIHTCDYEEPSIFKDKNVMIIGAGNSACDIACDAVSTASHVSVSMRRGYYFIPKFIFGMPADEFGETSNKLRVPMLIQQYLNQFILRVMQGNLQKLGFPKPDHRLFESHPIVNELLIYHVRHGDIFICGDVQEIKANYVKMKNGTNILADFIVLATGYQHDFTFLDKNLQPNPDNLFLNIFSKKHEGLSFLGLLDPNSGVISIIEQQAVAVAKAIESKINLTDLQQLFQSQPKLNAGINYINSDRHEYEVNSSIYRRELKRLLKKLGEAF